MEKITTIHVLGILTLADIICGAFNGDAGLSLVLWLGYGIYKIFQD